MFIIQIKDDISQLQVFKNYLGCLHEKINH
jgi:hypothetical protein